MNVEKLVDFLSLFPTDMEVFIQTVPDDLCQPLTTKHLSVLKASLDGGYIGHAKFLFTAHHPDRSAP